jgi:hypothetical protein
LVWAPKSLTYTKRMVALRCAASTLILASALPGQTKQNQAEHVVERFHRTDFNNLDYEAAVEDPNVFEKPWTISRGFPLRPELTKVDEFICENNHDYSKFFEKQ